MVPGNGNGVFWYRGYLDDVDLATYAGRYSFDYGNVHVIQFSSEHNWLPGSEQYMCVMMWNCNEHVADGSSP